ncbi:MAG: hypothetical protein NTU85_03600 [Candidatus Kaiserbacteria bacterium]|nr:hypothetical protein [Candidatus Kaiserbacteria bacterium]
MDVTVEVGERVTVNLTLLAGRMAEAGLGGDEPLERLFGEFSRAGEQAARAAAWLGVLGRYRELLGWSREDWQRWAQGVKVLDE